MCVGSTYKYTCMPVTQTKKQADIEKRLKILRKQVYSVRPVDSVADPSLPTSSHTSNSNYSQADITYLRQDLIKIITFATVAFVIQIVLYFLLRNQILNIKLF